jgi:FOG: Ankyrin repeat
MAKQHFDAVYRRDVGEIRQLLTGSVSAEDTQNAAAGLRAAIEANFEEIVEVYLEAGLDLNIRDQSGYTPLICAAAMGRLAIVRRLLAAGCGVNVPDSDSMTALHHAAIRQDELMLQVLVANGANPEHRSSHGKTALELARLRFFTIGRASGVYPRVWDTPAVKYLLRLSEQTIDPSTFG